MYGSRAGIAEELLPAQAFVFFLAGFETSSNTMGNLMTELSQHRHVQERMRREVDEVLARHDGCITYDALHEMTYMEQVIDGESSLYDTRPEHGRGAHIH